MLKPVIAACLLCVASSSVATVQCGPFSIAMAQPGVFFVNHVKAMQVTTRYTGKPGDSGNVRYYWIVNNTHAPGKLAMEHQYAQGKATLNVDVVRTRSQPIRISGDYDCSVVK
ncbi:hypothetical protein EHW64_11415 [Erwinia psidii]|uniref:hypothetical protein n=1 Tax=Erwinia psidii TaxID=69224 RepID=UPI00226B1C35|nr:hypothetical protein [Erwinia psidii]MCX8961730.1 hypothetical protein [Erwinia psidii]